VVRQSLAVFGSVYRFVEAAWRRSWPLWASAAAELSVAAGLAPLLSCDLAADVFQHVLATDASETGQGVVACTPARGVALAREDGSALFPSSPSGDVAVVATVPDMRWRTIVSSRWRMPEHVNVLEARALITGVRWALRHPDSVGRRVRVIMDSTVCVGAARKGRSSSPTLLRRMRALAAEVMRAELQLELAWVASANNPADGPSRA
jgi:hypothetical protein